MLVGIHYLGCVPFQ